MFPSSDRPASLQSAPESSVAGKAPSSQESSLLSGQPEIKNEAAQKTQAPETKPATQQDFDLAVYEGRWSDAERLWLKGNGNIDPGTVIDRHNYSLLIFMAEEGRDLTKLLKIPSVRKNIDDDRSGKTALALAIEKGHTDQVTALLKAGSDPAGRKNSAAHPPLISAIYYYRPSIVQKLLEFPAVKQTLNNRIGQSGWFGVEKATALHHAVVMGCRDSDDKTYESEKLEIVDLLLKAGANPLISSHGDEVLTYQSVFSGRYSLKGETPLYTAVMCGHNPLIQRLLSLPDVRHSIYNTQTGRMTFIKALAMGSSVRDLFFEAGINPLIPNEHGHTLLYELEEVALAEIPRRRHRSGSFYNPLLAGDRHFYKFLESIPDISKHINSKDRRGRTVLFLAVGRGYPLSLELLLQAGANPLVSDSEGKTPMNIALYYGEGEIITQFLEIPSVVKNLSDRELEYSLPFLDLSRIVSKLIEQEDIESAEYLLKKPFIKEQLNKQTDIKRVVNKPNIRQTPLFTALWEGNLSVVNLLLEAGANPLISDTEGSTALMVTSSPAVMERLLEFPEVKNSINARNHLGETAFFRQVSFSQLDTMNLLLTMGADPLIPDTDGNTPLMEAIRILTRKNSWLSQTEMEKVRTVALQTAQRLLEIPAVRGAINYRNRFGATALSLAMNKYGGSPNWQESPELLQFIQQLKEQGATLPSGKSGKQTVPKKSFHTKAGKAVLIKQGRSPAQKSGGKTERQNASEENKRPNSFLRNLWSGLKKTASSAP